jgi:hypothetical protein
MVDEEMRRDGLTWRMMRVEAYLSTNKDDNASVVIKDEKIDINHKKLDDKTIDDEDEDGLEDYLIPYNDEYSDRGMDKVIRVVDCSLQVSLIICMLTLFTYALLAGLH